MKTAQILDPNKSKLIAWSLNLNSISFCLVIYYKPIKLFKLQVLCEIRFLSVLKIVVTIELLQRCRQKSTWHMVGPQVFSLPFFLYMCNNEQQEKRGKETQENGLSPSQAMENGHGIHCWMLTSSDTLWISAQSWTQQNSQTLELWTPDAPWSLFYCELQGDRKSHSKKKLGTILSLVSLCRLDA